MKMTMGYSLFVGRVKQQPAHLNVLPIAIPGIPLNQRGMVGIPSQKRTLTLHQLTLPMDLQEDIPENHLVRVINDAVNHLDMNL